MKMSDTKVYAIFILALLAVATIIGYSHTIFPVMDDDEFFVDKNDVIHNGGCPYKGVPFFTTKRSKYEFIKERDWVFCNECFSKAEISKLMMLHDCNVEVFIDRLQKAGASTEYIDNRLEEMGLE